MSNEKVGTAIGVHKSNSVRGRLIENAGVALAVSSRVFGQVAKQIRSALGVNSIPGAIRMACLRRSLVSQHF